MKVRPSGYVSRGEELWYGFSSPVYDWLVWWCFLPLGGEEKCRDEFVQWIDSRAGQRVVSLCCGTGTTEAHLLRRCGDLDIVAIDLGRGQIATARRKVSSPQVSFRVGDASNTGLADGAYDRVLITLALHEMPAELRLSVLREASRLCADDGRIVVIEHGRPTTRRSRWARDLWWFTFVPGNPETKTTRDMQRRGLENEMREADIDVQEHHEGRYGWIEGFIGRPRERGARPTQP